MAARNLTHREGNPHWRTGKGGIRVPRLALRISDNWLSFFLVAPALGLMTVYVLYPLWEVISGSFLQSFILGQPGHFVGLANFQALLANGQFLPALQLSVYYTVGNIVLQLGLGLPIALLLNMKLPGRNIARGAVLFPFIVPAVVAALIWTFVLDPNTGIVDYVMTSLRVIHQPIPFLTSPSYAMNTVIVISTWKYVPLIIILFLARLQTIPSEVLEAARCDGANGWQVFRHVIWPWVLPVALVAVMARTILSFNEFDMPYLLAHGGPLESVTTAPVLVREVLNSQNDFGSASAMSLVMMAILVIVLIGYLVVYRRGERMLDG